MDVMILTSLLSYGFGTVPVWGKAVTLVLLNCALLLIPKSVSASYGPAKDDRQYARLKSRLICDEQAYAKYEPELKDWQKRICQTRLRVRRAELNDRPQKEIIELYKQLQELILDERRRNRDKIPDVWRGNSTLWRVFNIEKPLLYTCFAISEICRDSENMAVEENLRQIKPQAELSNDYRLRQMVIDLLAEDKRYQDAIDYCQKQISDRTGGKKNKGHLWIYQYELVKVRLMRQRALFEQAMKEQGIVWDEVINAGKDPFNVNWRPWETARNEVQRYVRENPVLAAKCLSIIDIYMPILGVKTSGKRQEIKEFYKTTASKLKEKSGSTRGAYPRQEEQTHSARESEKVENTTAVHKKKKDLNSTEFQQPLAFWKRPSVLVVAPIAIVVFAAFVLYKKMPGFFVK